MAADVDVSRAGLLRVAPELVGRLFRLPPSCRIADLHVTITGDYDLLVVGEPLPRRTEGADPERVTVICQQILRRDGTIASRMHFAHAPKVDWSAGEDLVLGGALPEKCA